MMVRRLLAAVALPFLLVACGDSTSSAVSSAGASPIGVNIAGAAAGGAPSSSGGVGLAVGGAGAGRAGGHDEAGAGRSASGGGASTSTAGATGAGGTAGQSTSMAGSGGAASGGDASGGAPSGGVPPGWLTVTDVDYSIVPGPNFETVRLMFEAAQCTGSSCHYGGRNHFQMGKAADQLYSYMMSFKTLQCGKLIDTANPSQSALVKYLRGPCGDIDRMPAMKCFDDGDELCVPEYYIQAIEAWIAKGAPR